MSACSDSRPRLRLVTDTAKDESTVLLPVSEARYIVCIMSSETEHIAHTSGPGTRPDAQALYLVAETQGGYFTTGQAADAGYSRSLLGYHARSGMFTRVHQGVYRLARFPASQIEDLHAAHLLAGTRSVISHDSALALYDLSDILPSEIHITVPRTSSRRRRHLRFHTSSLGPDEITDRDGLPVTTVARTLADVANTGLSDELIFQVAQEALERGLMDSKDLQEQVSRRRGRAKRVLTEVLELIDLP